MGLASHRSPSPRQGDASGGVGVIDTIEMKEALRVAHAPGVVAVLDSFPSDEPQAYVGRAVRLLAPTGRVLVARVDAVRNHGTTISFFFPGLTREDIPVGSRIEFDD